MDKRCYINSITQVSCQEPLTDNWFTSPVTYGEPYARAQEPGTGNLIQTSAARRMSRILKRSVSTAMTALNNSAVNIPDAIITGTGMGCMENSEKFLTDLCVYGENCLKPTLFMQSTHNTISSTIAIMLKCHGYNNTYSHKGISFESALLDSLIQIKSGMANSVLTGGHDEVTPLMASVLRHTNPEYGFISEASVSAVLVSDERADNICELESVELFNSPEPADLADILDRNNDDVMITGINGNPLNDDAYFTILSKMKHKPAVVSYKHLFGDNFSASAISFLVGTEIIRKQSVPDFLFKQGDTKNTDGIKSISIINRSGDSWSLIRLKKI